MALTGKILTDTDCFLPIFGESVAKHLRESG